MPALLTLSPATKPPCLCGCGKVPVWGHWVRGHWLKRNQNALFWETFSTPTPPPMPTPTAAWRPQPERALLLATLDDAWTHKKACKRVICYQCSCDHQWACDTATTFLFAFQSICDVLGFDGDRVRVLFLATSH